MIGQTISHYRIDAELGHGGMGIVYKGTDEKLGRAVAIKLLPTSTSRDPRARKRFENEARAASALNHPNICTIHEIGEGSDGQLFIAMALYSGQTLENVLEKGALPIEECVRIVSELAKGLGTAHRAGIIHRDIKPGNVMLTDDGRVVILDFGLAKVDEVNITQDDVSVGTVSYMSPEQARGGELDARTDVWSLGILFYEMLAGVKPFNAQYSQAVLYTILNEEPTPISELVENLPEFLGELVTDCLFKDPADRIENMQVVQERLTPESHESKTLLNLSVARLASVAFIGAIVIVLAVIVAIPGMRTSLLNAIGPGALPAEKHVVVLASLDASSSDEDAALEAGFVETLIATLQKVESGAENFWVVPSSRTLRANVIDPAGARKNLGVNLAIVLDVTQSAEELGLSMSLVDTESGDILRSQLISHARADIGLVRADMTRAIAELLGLDIGPGIDRYVSVTQSVRPGAADFYTQGLGYLNRYAEGENLDASIILFGRAIDADSSFALAHAGLCTSYLRKWQRLENAEFATLAEQSCEKALEFQSDLSSVYVTLGLLHTGTGRYGTALGEFQLALARDSSDVEALIGLAGVYGALGRLGEAEQSYKRAIAQKPDYWYSYSNLGAFYYNQSRYDDAVEQFLIVTDLNPFNARGYSNLGAIYFYLDQRTEAIEMFTLAIEIQDEFASWKNLGTLYYYEGQYEESATAFEHALSLSDNASFETWGYLASAYKWSNQPDKEHEADLRALELARDALIINPRDQNIMAHLATYYASFGHADSSRAILAELTASPPDDAQNLSRMGEAFELLGDRAGAIEWTERALQNGYALAEVVDYPGFASLLADPEFQTILEKYQTSDETDVLE